MVWNCQTQLWLVLKRTRTRKEEEGRAEIINEERLGKVSGRKEERKARWAQTRAKICWALKRVGQGGTIKREQKAIRLLGPN